MPSTLGRLFDFAKAPTSSAIENFTTEALAGAIRADPRPFLLALRRRSLAGSQDETADVMTQLVVPGTGVLDLVAVLTSGRELWVEVKVDAWESGRQLNAYIEAARRRSPAAVVLTLGKRPIRSADELPSVSWQELRSAIRDTGEASPFWRDLELFMAERGMADDLDEPIAGAEANSMGPAFRLYRKGARILAATVTEARPRWSGFRWPANEDAVRDEVLKKFHRLGRLFVVGHTSTVAYLVIGFDHPSDVTHASVWLETKPSGIGLQGEIFALARRGLGPEWRQRPGRYGGLQVTQRLTDLGPHGAVVAWFLERLAQLDRAGLLALVTGAPPSAELEAVDEE